MQKEREVTEYHDWIEYDTLEAKIGITKVAQEELGEIVYLELPEVGTRVQKGDQIAVLESTKAAIDVYAPLSGTILEINEVLKTNTDLLNASPEKDGWLYKLKMDQ